MSEYSRTLLQVEEAHVIAAHEEYDEEQQSQHEEQPQQLLLEQQHEHDIRTFSNNPWRKNSTA